MEKRERKEEIEVIEAALKKNTRQVKKISVSLAATWTKTNLDVATELAVEKTRSMAQISKKRETTIIPNTMLKDGIVAEADTVEVVEVVADIVEAEVEVGVDIVVMVTMSRTTIEKVVIATTMVITENT